VEKETHWSKFASDFEQQCNYVAGKQDMNIIRNRLSGLGKLQNTLELGCGPGTYSRILAEQSDDFFATDFSGEMVNAAKQKLKAVPNIKVERANCFDLPFDAHSFDTVFMANLLHVIAEPVKALIESKRVLKSGGRIIILSFTSDGMTFFNKLGMGYRYFRTWGKPPSGRTTLTVKKVQAMLELNGFEVEESELIGNKSKAVFAKALSN
jgi:ABC-2 type transport system ATP-binding protein